MKDKTGAPKVAIVALSRGGYSTRRYVAANPASVVAAALGGTPNHGVWATDWLLGSEYNGRGPFLQKLNTGESEVTPGVPFLTLRSDGFDLYAQPNGRFIGRPDMATNVTAEGPALKGATNILLGEVDHRETATSPQAFAEIYRFLVGGAPQRIAIAREAEVVLNGRVTGVVDGTPTNRPVEGARVEVYRVSADTGERQGGAALTKTTGADGLWGPLTVDAGRRSNSSSRRPARPSPTFIAHRSRARSPSFIWRRRRSTEATPTRRRSCGWTGRAAILACRATSCSSTARSPPTSRTVCPASGTRS